MDRSARSLRRYVYARNLSFPPVRAPLHCLPLCRFSFLAYPISGFAPSSRESWPRKRREKRRAEGRRWDAKGVWRGKEAKGKRRLKYHEDIIRYRRVVYPYRPPYRIKQPSILIHDDGTQQRDWDATGRKSRASWAELSRRDSQDRTLIGGARAWRKRSERQGRKQDAFFGHARSRRHYSHEDRKHRGARREGWDPWIIARSYFFFLYIVLSTSEACTHTKRRAGYHALADTVHEKQTS